MTILGIVKKLKRQADKGEFIDIGTGANTEFHTSEARFGIAVKILEHLGYPVQNVSISQLKPHEGEILTLTVLCPKGSEPGAAFHNRINIKPVSDFIDKRPTYLHPRAIAFVIWMNVKVGNYVKITREDLLAMNATSDGLNHAAEILEKWGYSIRYFYVTDDAGKKRRVTVGMPQDGSVDYVRKHMEELKPLDVSHAERFIR